MKRTRFSSGPACTRWRTRRWCLMCAGFAAAVTTAFAEIRVIEETAIPFTRFLSKADFDQRFPGELKSGPSALETGWYVIYEHESLSYYFGPVLLESTGRDYLGKLEETVEAAVALRPDIVGYRLELSYEPSAPVPDSGAPDPGANEPPSGSGQPTPPPPPSIWGFFKRLFGFG